MKIPVPGKWLLIGLVSAVAIGFLTPIAVSKSRARALYGDFDWGGQCMGGHEIFLHLDEFQAYENCPGHRDMSLIGPIDRDSASVTVRTKGTNTPWCRVDLVGNRHTLSFTGDEDPIELPQVSNPWRTWFPSLLPE